MMVGDRLPEISFILNHKAGIAVHHQGYMGNQHIFQKTRTGCVFGAVMTLASLLDALKPGKIQLTPEQIKV